MGRAACAIGAALASETASLTSSRTASRSLVSGSQPQKHGSEDDENEPNPTEAAEVSVSAPIEIVKTNPIQEVKDNVKEGIREIEPNSLDASGGGAFPAPTPDQEIDPAMGLCPSASVQDGRCG